MLHLYRKKFNYYIVKTDGAEIQLDTRVDGLFLATSQEAKETHTRLETNPDPHAIGALVDSYFGFGFYRYKLRFMDENGKRIKIKIPYEEFKEIKVVWEYIPATGSFTVQDIISKVRDVDRVIAYFEQKRIDMPALISMMR